MKQLFVMALCCCLNVANANENEKIIKSKPEKIIIYTQGAQIHRTSTTNLLSGQNTLIFSGLENCINISAIQASGNGNFIITDIQHEIHYPEFDKAKLQGDVKYKKTYKQINDSLRDINYDLDDLQLKTDALSTEKNVLLNYGLYKGVSKKDSIAFLKDGLAFLREKLFNINSELLKIRKEKEKIELKRNLLTERLNLINNDLNNRDNVSADNVKVDYRVLIHVIADQATQATIILNYPITNAGWTASYDLRANSTDQNVKLTYKAQIHQQSGIDWENVKLVLSTANPNRSFALPNLQPWQIANFRYKNYTLDDTKKDGYEKSLKSKATNDISYAMPQLSSTEKPYEDEIVEAKQIYNYTTVTENLIETEYDIKLNYNIPSDGKKHFAAIMVKDLKTIFRYKAVPKLTSNVYLTAVVTDWEDAISMSGSASIYYDGTYVGLTTLKMAGTDDTMQLSLGIDKNIAVTRKKIKDKCYEKLLVDDKVHQYSYDIITKNLRSTKIEIDIEDQLPLSQDKTVSIEKKELSNGKYDELTGLIKWRVTLLAKDSKKINLTYQIKAPKQFHIAFN